jgi:hypothetical protein
MRTVQRTVVAVFLAAVALFFSPCAAADEAGVSGTDGHHVEAEVSDTAGTGSAPPSAAADSPPPTSADLPPPAAPVVGPAGQAESPAEQNPIIWPWLEGDPGGYDKCKRKMPWPLPDWCSGLSNWPVMRAHAVNATVPGIRGGASGVGHRQTSPRPSGPAP